jgi:AcrR family transcriptional regulator
VSSPENPPKANRGPSAGPDNRKAIIAAAREVFAEQGIRAPLNAVARRAGVGQGSLYRHFPDRLTLAVAVLDENIVELEQLGDRPGSTIDDLFVSVAEQAMVSTTLTEIVAQNQHDERARDLGVRVRGVVERLVANDRGTGRIGAGVTSDDVLAAISMVAFAVAYTPQEDRPDLVGRARRIFHVAFERLPGGSGEAAGDAGPERAG